MNTTDGKIWYQQGISNAGLRQGQKEAKAIWSQMEGDASAAGMSVQKIWSMVGVAGAGIAAKQLIGSIVQVRGEFQKLETAFGVLLGSEEKANKLMSEAVQLAATTPFGLKDVASGARQLLAYGFAAEDIIGDLRRLGDVSSALGLPLERLTYLYGTTMTQGRLYTRDLMQFTTSGIPLLQALADQFGVSTQKVNEMVTAGEIGFPEVQKAIYAMTGEGGRFNNMMGEMAKTIPGQIEKLKDAWQVMLNDIGKNRQGVIAGSIEAVASLVENYEKVGKILIGLVATYGAYRSALIFATAATKGWTAAELIHYKVLVIVDKAQKLLNATMLKNPLVLVTTLVVGLVATMWALRDSTTAAERAQERLNKRQEEFAQKEQERRSRIDELIRIIQDETQTLYAQITAYEELEKLSPALAKAYNQEELAVLDLADANKALNAEQDKRNYDKLISDIDNARKSIVRLKEMFDLMASTPDSGFGLIRIGKQIDEQEAGLAILEQNLSDYNKRMAEAEFNALPPAEKIKIKEEQLAKIRSEFERVKAVIEEEEKKLADRPYYYISPQLRAQFSGLRSQMGNAEAELNALKNLGTTTKNEPTEEQKKQWAVEAKRRKEQAEKDAKDLSDLRDQLASDAAQAEVDKMAEGADKKRAQANLDFEREKTDIIRRKKELRELQGGSLTDEQNTKFESLNAAAKARNKATIDAINKEEIDNEKAKATELLKNYGSYLERRASLTEEWEKEIAEIPVQYQAGAREKMIYELAALDDEYQQFSQGIEDLFERTSKKSIDELERVSAKAKAIFDALKNNDYDAYLVAEGNSANRMTREQFDIFRNSSRDMEETADGIDNLNRKVFESQNAFKRLGQAIKEAFNGVDKKQAFSDIGSAIGEISDLATSVGDSVGQIFLAFGNEDVANIAKDITGIVSGVAEAGQGVAKIMSGDIVGGIKDTISGIANTITSIFSLSDRDNEKRIKNLQKRYDALSKQIDRVDDQIEIIRELQDETYSKERQNAIDDETKSLEEQNKAQKEQIKIIERQIQEERDKKKTDNGRIEQWQEQIDSLNQSIEDNNRAIEDNKDRRIDAIYGQDIQSAIEDFAGAWADAWDSGTPTKDSIKKSVKDLLKAAIIEAVKSTPDLVNALAYLRKTLIPAMMADNILTDDELKQLEDYSNSIADDLDAKYGGFGNVLKDENSTSRSSASQGFAQISQDSFDRWLGIQTNIENHTFDIRAGVVDISEMMRKNQQIQQANTDNILGRLTNIDLNTRPIAEMQKDIHYMRGRTDDMADSLDKFTRG